MAQQHVDIVIVGSGFSGLAVAAYLKRAGRDDFLILERASDVGGTWRDNSYPGCACDVPSHLYSFSFAPNPDWSSTFSPQAEIYSYLHKTAKTEALLPHIRFNTELAEASWQEKKKHWKLRTAKGIFTARMLVLATGPFSEPAIPDIPGLKSFPGTVFHSGAWDHRHKLDKKRIAVVGTGPSGTQFVPYIQPKAEKLFIFQRTAPWIIPRLDRQITHFERGIYKKFPVAQKFARNMMYWNRELFVLPFVHPRTTPLLKIFCKLHMRWYIRDPRLRQKLTPDYEPGCKRIVVSSEYFPTVAKPNVQVLTSGVVKVRGRTVVAQDGTEREVDTIILGTGFHVTEPPIAKRISGRKAQTLHTAWADGMQAHRGTLVAGFPNLFVVPGPNTIPAPTSLILTAETQAAYIVRALDYLDTKNKHVLEAKAKAQATWTHAIHKRMKHTVWVSGCSSWYLDANGRNTTLWPDFTFRFRKALARFDPSEYHFS